MSKNNKYWGDVEEEVPRHQTWRDYSWLHRLIHVCENCLGLEPEYGGSCYCEYNGAVAPGVGPTKWHLFWRWVWELRA